MNLGARKKVRAMRMLGLGDSGTGKTGSLVEVCNNMDRFGLERVVIQDWDDGLEVLENFVKPEALEKIFVVTLKDDLVPQPDGSYPLVKGADSPDKTSLKRTMAWPRGMQTMNNWKIKDAENLGPAKDWGLETLFVCDTLTGMGDASMNYTKVFFEPNSDWKAVGKAMRFQDGYIQICCKLSCHFIMFAHVRWMGGGGKIAVKDKDVPQAISYKEVDSGDEGTAYPSALGRILPTQMARHFNAQLEWKIQGSRRVVATSGSERFPLKVPVDVPKELPQETALVKIFEAMSK